MITTRPLPLGGLVAPHRLPQDVAVFLVGDIHGQWKALTQLLDAMRRTQTGTHARVLVTTGDAIHKGPQSRRVLHALLTQEAAERSGMDTHVPLLGNHEILFARALMALESGPHDAPWISAWARGGGNTLLSSWKKDRPNTTTPARLARWRDGFGANLAGLASWGKAWEDEGLTAVHAGFSPTLDWASLEPMQAYSLARGRLAKHPEHWATIRAPFLDWTQGFGGRLIVHGHTPPRSLFGRPPRRANDLLHAFDHSAAKGRVCLDGGAGFGIGVAGALIHNGTIRFYFVPC